MNNVNNDNVRDETEVEAETGRETESIIKDGHFVAGVVQIHGHNHGHGNNSNGINNGTTAYQYPMIVDHGKNIFDSEKMQNTPSCGSCKEKNYTRTYCRTTKKHKALPWSTVYIVLTNRGALGVGENVSGVVDADGNTGTGNSGGGAHKRRKIQKVNDMKDSANTNGDTNVDTNADTNADGAENEDNENEDTNNDNNNNNNNSNEGGETKANAKDNNNDDDKTKENNKEENENHKKDDEKDDKDCIMNSEEDEKIQAAKLDTVHPSRTFLCTVSIHKHVVEVR